MADNEIRLNVTAVESEPLNVCVEQVPMNPVNVENTYKGIDYNLLKNKPAIDGVTLEGDKTTAEVIGFDKEYVDEAILTTNAKIDSVEQDLSDRIDNISVSTDVYTKEEIDNKVIVIEADIDAQADAIQKTRSDFMESDSELQQQINAHANELTTQKNDIDELGDQVAEIESKIPESTSDTNPLINKQQLLDEEMDIREDMMESDSELQTQINALAEAIQGGGGGSVPDNVYTQDNLIAGKNVTFTEVPPDGGIDEHTVAVWHFDGNTNWVDDRGTVYQTDFSYQNLTLKTEYKFGTGSAASPGYTGARFSCATLENNYGMKRLNMNGSFTLDFWFLFGNNYESATYTSGFGFTGSTNGFYWNLVNDLTEETTFQTNIAGVAYQTRFVPTEKGLVKNTWHHIAMEYYVKDDSTGTSTFYIDGTPVASIDFTVGTSAVLDTFQFGGRSGQIFDEVRISNIARYKGENFTPPTKPYKLATGPSKTAVNATVPTKTSELENDSGFLTGLPDNVYTQTNLLGGKDIEIVPEPVEGGIDEHTIAVWHFDGNTNWVDDRGVEYPSDFTYQQVYLDSSNTKFGNGSGYGPNYAGAWIDPVTLQANYGMKRANRNESFTIDWWSLTIQESSGTDFTGKMGFIGTNYGFEIEEITTRIADPTNKINIRTAGVQQSATFDATVFGAEYRKWVHKALEYDCSEDEDTAVARLYINGHIAATIEGIEKSAIEMGTFSFCGKNEEFIDELRISKTARYKGVDFSDSLPTKAYSVAAPTGNMVVNYVEKQNMDYVVESYNEGTNWYRIYKSGWIEQGGQIISPQDMVNTITFLKPFADTSYYFNRINESTVDTTPTNFACEGYNTKTTTSIAINANAEYAGSNIMWHACGQGA